MGMFAYLKFGISFILAFVGLKMILMMLGLHIPISLSLTGDCGNPGGCGGSFTVSAQNGINQMSWLIPFNEHTGTFAIPWDDQNCLGSEVKTCSR